VTRTHRSKESLDEIPYGGRADHVARGGEYCIRRPVKVDGGLLEGTAEDGLMVYRW
jgi:hypothetical protein